MKGGSEITQDAFLNRLNRPVYDQGEENGPHKNDAPKRTQIVLTIGESSGDEFKRFVQQYDRYRELHHGEPFFDG